MEDLNKEMSEPEKINAEINELASLTELGGHFKVGNRTFVVKEPYLGTLDILSSIFIKMDFDVRALNDNAMPEGKRMAASFAKSCAKVLAVATLNNKWKIRLFTRGLAAYFYWHITPKKLFQFAQLINASLNMADFIGSIISMSAARTTRPEMIEQNQKA